MVYITVACSRLKTFKYYRLIGAMIWWKELSISNLYYRKCWYSNLRCWSVNKLMLSYVYPCDVLWMWRQGCCKIVRDRCVLMLAAGPRRGTRAWGAVWRCSFFMGEGFESIPLSGSISAGWLSLSSTRLSACYIICLYCPLYIHSSFITPAHTLSTTNMSAINIEEINNTTKYI